MHTGRDCLLQLLRDAAGEGSDCGHASKPCRAGATTCSQASTWRALTWPTPSARVGGRQEASRATTVSGGMHEGEHALRRCTSRPPDPPDRLCRRVSAQSTNQPASQLIDLPTNLPTDRSICRPLWCSRAACVEDGGDQHPQDARGAAARPHGHHHRVPGRPRYGRPRRAQRARCLCCLCLPSFGHRHEVAGSRRYCCTCTTIWQSMRSMAARILHRTALPSLPARPRTSPLTPPVPPTVRAQAKTGARWRGAAWASLCARWGTASSHRSSPSCATAWPATKPPPGRWAAAAAAAGTEAAPPAAAPPPLPLLLVPPPPLPPPLLFPCCCHLLQSHARASPPLSPHP